jgi:hypothetical protein
MSFTPTPGACGSPIASEIDAPHVRRTQELVPEPSRHAETSRTSYERQLYLRPSRYCPSDHLVGFAVAEFQMRC